MTKLTIHPGKMSLNDLRIVLAQPVTVALDKRSHLAIEKSVATVNKIIAEDKTAYGINTGFGLLANTRIAAKDLQSLQRSIVMSHAAGVGEPLDDELVRLIMVLKINSLARGFSGIRLEVIEALIALVNHQDRKSVV